jgi:hypothetical protein
MTDLAKAQPLDTIRTWQDASKAPTLTATSAERYLPSFGEAYQFLQSAELNFRMALGNFFIVFQAAGLHEHFGHSTWTEFRSDGLPKFNLSHGLVAQAMELAKSKTLQQLPPEERGMISVSNGSQLARHERVNGHVKPEVIEMAKTLKTGEFIVATGGTVGAWVKVWVPDREAAPHILRAMEWLKKLSPSAAEAFANLLEMDDIHLLAGDGADNQADAIVAAMEIAMQNEIDQARANQKVLRP